MSVRPEGLDRIPPHSSQAAQLETRSGERSLRAFVEVSHDIPFALTPGTRTRPPQNFETDKPLGAIIPSQGQLVANLLNINQTHPLTVLQTKARVHIRTETLIAIFGEKNGGSDGARTRNLCRDRAAL